VETVGTERTRKHTACCKTKLMLKRTLPPVSYGCGDVGIADRVNVLRGGDDEVRAMCC
jgi:hypothetical protein